MRLYLCEKPSQGKDIAAVLGAKTRGDGCLKGPGVAVTWGIGHLLETAAPDAYGDHLKNWSLDTLTSSTPSSKRISRYPSIHGRVCWTIGSRSLRRRNYTR